MNMLVSMGGGLDLSPGQVIEWFSQESHFAITVAFSPTRGIKWYRLIFREAL